MEALSSLDCAVLSFSLDKVVANAIVLSLCCSNGILGSMGGVYTSGFCFKRMLIDDNLFSFLVIVLSPVALFAAGFTTDSGVPVLNLRNLLK